MIENNMSPKKLDKLPLLLQAYIPNYNLTPFTHTNITLPSYFLGQLSIDEAEDFLYGKSLPYGTFIFYFTMENPQQLMCTYKTVGNITLHTRIIRLALDKFSVKHYFNSIQDIIEANKYCLCDYIMTRRHFGSCLDQFLPRAETDLDKLEYLLATVTEEFAYIKNSRTPASPRKRESNKIHSPRSISLPETPRSKRFSLSVQLVKEEISNKSKLEYNLSNSPREPLFIKK